LKILVKLGGTLLDDPASRDRLARGIVAHARFHQLVVVHGGGKQMTRYLADRGVESQFVNGLRVTTPEVVDALLKVFAGSVNKTLVSALVRAGAEAVGLTGIDAALTEAEQLDPALGAVGRPIRGNGRLLDVLTGAGYLPVIACVAGDRQGQIYNVNADQMAVACAQGFRAERLVFLTDVEGVLDGEQKRVPLLTLEESWRLVEEGIAIGGMQAKLRSANEALRSGIPEVVIAPGAREHVLERLASGESLGTRMVAGSGAAAPAGSGSVE
jgi:acetylglutamate kinase